MQKDYSFEITLGHSPVIADDGECLGSAFGIVEIAPCSDGDLKRLKEIVQGEANTILGYEYEYTELACDPYTVHIPDEVINQIRRDAIKEYRKSQAERHSGMRIVDIDPFIKLFEDGIRSFKLHDNYLGVNIYQNIIDAMKNLPVVRL